MSPIPLRRRGRDGGFSIIELMIACGLAAITAWFAFSVYARASVASRGQARVAEVQQAVRAATDLIVKDVRQAGYMISTSYSAHYNGTQYASRKPIIIANNPYSEGDDRVIVTYGDSTSAAHVKVTASHTTSRTYVDSLGGLTTGDVILGSVLTGSDRGKACVLEITATNAGGPYVDHDWTGGSLWNQTSNTQCDPIRATYWPDGNAALTKLIARAYRIKPSDARGVLQVSPSGMMISNDWADLALGIVDLQLAIRVYQAGDVTDSDGDGDATRDWYSGDNMNTVLDTGWQALQVSVTVLGRTTWEVEGPMVSVTPDFTSATYPNNNNLGDHAGTAVPVASTSSRYYGRHKYRYNSTIVDLRNMGIGN